MLTRDEMFTAITIFNSWRQDLQEKGNVENIKKYWPFRGDPVITGSRITFENEVHRPNVVISHQLLDGHIHEDMIKNRSQDITLLKILARNMLYANEMNAIQQSLHNPLSNDQWIPFDAPTIPPTPREILSYSLLGVVLVSEIIPNIAVFRVLQELGYAEYNEEIEKLAIMIKHGNPLAICNTSWVLMNPEEVHIDNTNRLHSEASYAVKWTGNEKEWWWHGTKVSQKVIETPDEITLDEVMNNNAEVRRATIEKITGDRFARLLNLKLEQTDSMGEIYSAKVVRNNVTFNLKFVKVKDASTTREYYIQVPRALTTAHQAVAWSFGMKDKDYNPLEET